jgi:hypothetical protein
MNTTSILRKKILSLTLFCVGVFLLLVAPLYAQEALTLSISPSLFDMSVNPGQEWRSSLRVINVNNYELTVYVDVVNFFPRGEGGEGQFVPVDTTEAANATLAEWFIVEREAIVIPPEQTREIPFAVRVPVDASPGGHFAAILVGTKPPTPEAGQAKVQTSQMVTSLFFARVAGDIKEIGSIREFITPDSFLSSPEATFELRFENKGNVHLQPQGEITIKNMWGEVRGVIPINQSTQFGNVLPESIRKFTFSWKGEWSVSDIGRYTALATLAYGTEARQFSSQETTFWVIPFKLLFGILLGLAVFGGLVTWLVRLYVRHMLTMAGIDVSDHYSKKVVRSATSRTRTVAMHYPVALGLSDLKQRWFTSATWQEKGKTLFGFAYRYKLFFIGVALVVCFTAVLIWYVASANTSHRGYEVEYINPDASMKLTSEEIIYNQFKLERAVKAVEVDVNLPKIKIINRSGVPGMGAEIKLRLEERGYQIISLEADFTSPQSRTVIVYGVEQDRDALRLSARLNNAPISNYAEPDSDQAITVYVGDDIRAEE